MARIGRFTDDQVVEIRELYEHQRDLADNDPEYYETVMETEERLAERFGVSRSMIRRIVLGLSYAEAGGPIDEHRRAADKAAAGESTPTAVRVTIARPGGKPKSYVHPPGTVITIDPIVEDPNDYGENGLPAKGAKAAPQTKTGMGKAPSAPPGEGETLHAELTRLERIPKARRKPHHDRRIDTLRAALGHGEPDSAGNASGNI